MLGANTDTFNRLCVWQTALPTTLRSARWTLRFGEVPLVFLEAWLAIFDSVLLVGRLASSSYQFVHINLEDADSRISGCLKRDHVRAAAGLDH